MSNFKRLTIISAVVVVAFVFSTVPAEAASLSSIPSQANGWGVSLDVANSVKVASKQVNGLDNRQSSIPALFRFSQTFTHSVGFSGSLSGELSGSIGATTANVSGGLGARIPASTSISQGFVYRYTQTYQATVPARKNLKLYSDAYGKRITGYAKQFALWMIIKQGTVDVKIPKYQVFRAVI